MNSECLVIILRDFCFHTSVENLTTLGIMIVPTGACLYFVLLYQVNNSYAQSYCKKYSRVELLDVERLMDR